MHRPPVSPTDHRERVSTLLALLACGCTQDVFADRVDPERFAFELCRTWFDDVYLPAVRYLDSWKGDFSEEAAREFRAAFDGVELAALERFHRFFELRVDMLAHDRLTAGRIPINDAWASLSRHASYVLEELDPDAAGRRARVETALDRSEWAGAPARLLSLISASRRDTERPTREGG